MLTSRGGEDSHLQQIVDDLDDLDATARYREEAADNNLAGDDGQRQHDWSASSSDNEALIVAWEENDPENPYNWSSVGTRNSPERFMVAPLS